MLLEGLHAAATCPGTSSRSTMAIYSVYTLSKDDPEARNWLAFLHRHGYTGLSNLMIERVYWLEGKVSFDRLIPLLVNSLYQVAGSRTHLDPARGPIIKSAHRPSVTDPATASIPAG